MNACGFPEIQGGFPQRRSGKPDTFQSYDEAHKAITNNRVEIFVASRAAPDFTPAGHYQVGRHHNPQTGGEVCMLYNSAALSHCTFRSLDARFLVSMYSYGPDQQNDKPFWQRIFGFRRLLGSTPSPSATSSRHIGKGRFWASQSISPSPDAPAQPQHGTAGTAGRPTLKRQNAFKLSEDESQALTQQLGIGTHGHSGSGHGSEGVTQEVAQPLHAEEPNSKAAVSCHLLVGL